MSPEKAWRPCFSRLRASSVDKLLWARPLLRGIPFPEALPPDSVRRARKLGHIRKLPQMPAPAEVPRSGQPEASFRRRRFHPWTWPSITSESTCQTSHQPCSTEHFPEGRRLGGGRPRLPDRVDTPRVRGQSLGAREGPLSWAFVLLRGLRWCSRPIAWEAASSSFQASCGPKQSETPTVRAS